MSITTQVRQLEEMFYDSMLHTKNAIATDHKLRQRVEHQDEGLSGLHMAICVDTQDPLAQGRIRVYTPLLCNRETPKDALPWANPISPLGGFDDCGAFWVPPAGSRVALLFHGGNRATPYYLGTIWDRHRGKDQPTQPGESHLDYWDNYPIQEYECLWQGRRNGYNFGSNDGDEVLPQWNTEAYNSYDRDSTTTFYSDPNQYGSITYPYIYGMKTPGKHSLKFVDGDQKCNLRWKRVELNSSSGGGILIKDDHLHPGGQWAFGDQIDIAFCHTTESDVPHERPCCDGEGGELKACSQIQCFGESEDGCGEMEGVTDSSVNRTDVKANPFYKRKEEMRWYDGAPTPMKNKCELPQSGIQIQAISGHQFVMDDSVDQPTGIPSWERDFDFGCNDTFKGKTFWRSATGHEIMMDDSEVQRKVRGAGNGIFIKTATNNQIILSDDTVAQGDDCGCPPNFGGRDRGITMQTTAKNLFRMSDHGVRQCASPRKNDGVPKLENTHNYEGYILLRSGYGLQLMMKDQDIQTETNEQFIQLLSPQKDNVQRGPHYLEMQETKEGPGLVMLRAGGVYYQVSYDDMVEVVGVDEENPSSKMSQITDNYLIDVKNYYYNHNDLTMYFAEKYIFLLAGRDCPVPEDPAAAAQAALNASNANLDDLSANEERVPDENGPCIYPIIVGQQPWKCPLTGYIHFGYIRDQNGNVFDSRSERVFTSGKRNPQVAQDSGTTGDPTPPRPLDDSPIRTDDYITAGGNPPEPFAGGPPAELPDNIGQQPPALPTDELFKPTNPSQTFPPIPD